MATIRIDIWRGREGVPKAGVRLSIDGKDQIEWHSRDGAYTVEFVDGAPFKAGATFELKGPGPELSGELKGKDEAEGEYKFRVIDPETGKILDPTIFVDP